MQTACIHVQGVEDKSNQPMNTLVTMDLPAGAEWRMGEPGRLENPIDVSDTCTHILGIMSNLTRPENMSVTQDLPARGAEPRMGEPNRLKNPTDACTHMQRVADDSRRPTDKLECIRKSQNGCKKLNLPAKSLKMCS